jgi:single-stranded-DNA-specific exonuclease
LKYRWVPRSSPDAGSTGITGVPAPVAAVLARRGFSPGAAAAFLSPEWNMLSPWSSIPGADRAAEVLAGAVRRGDSILIHGDFDADGITAAATAVRVLRRLGARADWHIPCRFSEGYGIGDTGTEKALSEGYGLFLTVDCGIGALEPVERLRRAGIAVVVTDHHLPGQALPDADAVVDPEVAGDEEAPWRRLSGAGVALMVLRGAAGKLDRGDMPELEPDLCAIGTACDVVDLLGDNRILMNRGLSVLRTVPSTGVAALMKRAGLSRESVRARDLSYVIGPRLNSAGRVSHADLAVRLLLTEDHREAAGLADRLEECNSLRRELDADVFDDARSRAGEGPCVVLGSDSWHPGVLGIAASRLVEELAVPVILVSFRDGHGRGSARSPEGAPIHDILQNALENGLLTRCGGHSVAAGLSMERDKLEPFREFMERRTSPENGRESARPLLQIDGRLMGTECSAETVRGIAMMEPFGPGNPEPVWIARNVYALTRDVVGRGRHLKMSLMVDGVARNAIGFHMVGRSSEFERPVDLAFVLREDTYRGGDAVQLHLLDVRPSAGTAP